jgi:hypothetical protein
MNTFSQRTKSRFSGEKRYTSITTYTVALPPVTKNLIPPAPKKTVTLQNGYAISPAPFQYAP